MLMSAADCRESLRRYHPVVYVDGRLVLTGTETVLFEWTRDGGNPAFREVLELVWHLP